MQLLVHCCPWMIWSRKIDWTPLENILDAFMILWWWCRKCMGFTAWNVMRHNER